MSKALWKLALANKDVKLDKLGRNQTVGIASLADSCVAFGDGLLRVVSGRRMFHRLNGSFQPRPVNEWRIPAQGESSAPLRRAQADELCRKIVAKWKRLISHARSKNEKTA